MQNSLQSHLTDLQDTLVQLTSLLTQPLPGHERADIQERIAIVNMAIDHYRLAHTLESEIRNNGAGTTLPSAVTKRDDAALPSYKRL